MMISVYLDPDFVKFLDYEKKSYSRSAFIKAILMDRFENKTN
jgi:hypothetical protein